MVEKKRERHCVKAVDPSKARKDLKFEILICGSRAHKKVRRGVLASRYQLMTCDIHYQTE